MRYLMSENPYIIRRFETGDSPTITIIDLSDDSVIVNAAAMSAITGNTSYFKYLFNPSPAVLTYYFYIASTTNEEYVGIIPFGGFPDDVLTDTAEIGGIPTVTEFNARTLPSADYVVTSDTIAGVTTAINLTNAPANGDLTATMKASVNAEADTALADYDPPTRTEAAADKAEVIAEVDANEVKIDAGFAAVPDTVLDEVVEGGYTMRQLLRGFISILAGKSAGGGTTTLTFQDVADSKARITATVDINGNRTNMALDLS